MTNPFQSRQPNIGSNRNVRTPQREAYQALVDYASNPEEAEREVGIVLPVGCAFDPCPRLRKWSPLPVYN